MFKIGLRLLITGAFGVLTSFAAHADIYKFVDGGGRVYYSDKPRHGGYRLIIRTREKPALAVGSGNHRTRFSSLIEDAANQHSLDPALLHAVIRAESAYNPEAVSHKGAVGLMQLMPETARRYGVRDPRNAKENVNGGARYLSDLLDMFGSDVRLALAAYNAGENAVIRYNNQIPPYPETQNYVSQVMAYYER